jgi:hypothetical protein
VGGEVAIRYLQHLLKVIEVYFFIDHKDAHHTKADAVIENFI